MTMHAWYSTQHALRHDPAIYENAEGKPTATTFVCRDFAEGQKFLREHMACYTDYQYVGIVGRCIHETPLPGDDIPGTPPNDRLLEIAARNPPPDSWWDEDQENLF